MAFSISLSRVVSVGMGKFCVATVCQCIQCEPGVVRRTASKQVHPHFRRAHLPLQNVTGHCLQSILFLPPVNEIAIITFLPSIHEIEVIMFLLSINEIAVIMFLPLINEIVVIMSLPSINEIAVIMSLPSVNNIAVIMSLPSINEIAVIMCLLSVNKVAVGCKTADLLMAHVILGWRRGIQDHLPAPLQNQRTSVRF